MENVETPKTLVDPEAGDFIEKESPEVERELRMMAELLLDIYIEKRRRSGRKPRASHDSNGFDTPEPGR